MRRKLYVAVAVLLLLFVSRAPAIASNIAVNLNAEFFFSNDAPWANAAAQVDPVTGYTYWWGYNPGTYQVTWSGAKAPAISAGAGTFTVNGPGRGTLNLQFIKPGPGGDVFGLNAKGVSNLQILAPDAVAGTPFRKPFLDRVDSLVHGSVIRYMDWMRTNGSQVTNWSDRNTSLYQTTAAGVSYENIVALSNYTQSSPWINIPVRATDDYVRQLARTLKNTLDPSLQVHVEYSNELWNGAFGDQYQYNIAQANADPQYDHPGEWGRAAQRAAERLRQIDAIFKQEFGGSSRVVPEIGGFVANTYWGQTEIDWLKKKGVNLRADNYHMAIAPYVPGGEGELGLKGDETKDQIFQKLNDYLNNQVRTWVHDYKSMTDAVGIALDSYEAAAGSFYALSNPAEKSLLSTFYDMQDDPRMGQLYKDFVTVWNEESGGGLFNAYGLIGSDTQWGQWYLLDDVNATHGPKWDALMSFVNATGSAPLPEPSLVGAIGIASMAAAGRRRSRRAA